MQKRNDRGRFVTRADSLGKSIGLRVSKQLETALHDFAGQDGVPVAVWCRQVVEAAILERQEEAE
ncbi:MAG: hypothetical protein F6J97_00935 [Leptolyngbya sp. SIO4C1]|nr:hypothetical protein [Leptolyngbya sp. SIO4C1]